MGTYGMQKTGYKSSEVTFEKVSPLFHLPISEASKSLNICPTLLKNICREMGISKWPHRQIKSLTNMIEKLESATPEPSENASLDAIIEDLRQKKNLMLLDPRVHHEALHQERKEFRTIYAKYTRARKSPSPERVFTFQATSFSPLPQNIPQTQPIFIDYPRASKTIFRTQS